MFSKILKQSQGSQLSVQFQQFFKFASQNQPKQGGLTSQVNQQPAAKKESQAVADVKPKKRFQYKHPNGLDTLKDTAYLEYKQYPFHISHMNPDSKDYVHCELTEYKTETAIRDYNLVVARLKNDIKVQEQVYQILEKMDRPYMRGQPGVDRNISQGLQDYFPPELPGKEFEDYENKLLEKITKNEDRFLNQTVFYPKYAKMTHYDVDWQKELDNRKINPNFNHDKGYKFDVITPYEERYPYMADRLGHPEILGTPFERLVRLEGEIYHPNHLDQPFVHVPRADPHASLNFEEGEVLYENTRLLEWSKLFIYSGLSMWVFSALFVPYQLIYKTHLPQSHAYDNIFLPYALHTPHYFDGLQLHIPLIGGVYLYSTYWALKSVNLAFRDYVIKAQYSKDKELLFVTRVSPYGSTEEEVYEMAHLELLPPSIKSGVAQLSSQDPDGLIDVTCLNTQTNLVMYQEDKYWNPTLRKEFLSKVTGLWTPDYVGFNRYEQTLNQEKEIQVSLK